MDQRRGTLENPQRANIVIDGAMRAPSATFEYMLYQALLGAWPLGQGVTRFPNGCRPMR